VSDVRTGISGWRYPPWRGVFYPPGLPQRLELRYAAGRLRTIEINGSFYSLQRPESYARWAAETPADFVFSVKGPRFVTHMKKLAGVEAPLANFFASGVLALGGKLGPVLWQLPPNLGYDPERLARFFAQLPRTTGAAAELAAGHDERMEGRALLTAPADRPLRHALEVRHASFETAGFVELLRAHDVALVVADTAGKWPLVEDVTADVMYLRLHGDEVLYASGYSDAALDDWARRIDAWRRGGEVEDARKIVPELVPSARKSRDVYCYFDNDMKVHAPFDARKLIQKVEALDGYPRREAGHAPRPERRVAPGYRAPAAERRAQGGLR
jgi:uncharacterized protein YecE (DUF72 family)